METTTEKQLMSKAKKKDNECAICGAECTKDNEYINTPMYFTLVHYDKAKIHICGNCQTKLGEKIRSGVLDKELMPALITKKITDYHQLFRKIKEVIYRE